MSIASSYLESSTTRPVPLRKRNDLVVVQQTYRHQQYWVVKDPLALEYFRFNEQEYAILDWIDGERDLETIRELFQRRFAPHRITCRELQSFITHLHRKSLVVHNGEDQGRHLLELARQRRKRELLGKLGNLYAIRSRGFDPDWLLNRLSPFVTWFFSKVCVALMSLFILSSFVWLLVHYQQVLAQLPTISAFFGPDNWMMLIGLISVTKILHELGHGFAFKRFGGECHEIGLLLLFFMPTLYCNTSDSWLLKNKWHRIAIGLAGMYVELVIFAAAAYGWWWSEPSTFHYICLNLMFVCSVNTVLFNGNPLMRYDGYFVLADLLELPNLKQQAGKTTLAWFERYGLGITDEQDDLTPRGVQRFYVGFAISAFTYRIVLLSAISFVLARRLEPFGLAGPALMFAGLVVSLIVMRPIMAVVRSLRKPGRMAQTNRRHVLVTAMIAGGIVLFVTAVPLPKSVVCDFSIESEDGRLVYVEEPGRVSEILIQPGDRVKAGQALLRLKNDDLEQEALELELQLAAVAARIQALQQAGSTRFAASTDPLQLQAEHDSLQNQLDLVNGRLERLTINSPTDGTVFAAIGRPRKSQTGEKLVTWQGSPLDSRNRFATFEKQQPVCVVGSPDQLEAVLIIPQHDVELVASRQNVKLMLNSVAGRRVQGTIARISVAETGLSQLPDLMARSEKEKNGSQLQRTSERGVSGDLSEKVNTAAGDLPSGRIFQASVPIRDPLPSTNIGSRGRARIFIGYRTIAWRLHRWLNQTTHVTF